MAKNPDRHYETPDPRPMAIPAGMKRPPTLAEQVARLVRGHQLQRELAEAGLETFEEADDFEIPDDMPDPTTPYEPFFDPVLGVELTPADIRRDNAKYAAETEKRVLAAKASKKPKEPEKAPPATPPATPPVAGPEKA